MEPTTSLFTNEQIAIVETMYHVKIDYDADNQCGQLEFNGQVFTVRAQNPSKDGALKAEDWKQIAAKVATMLGKKTFLNDKFVGAEINSKGITPLSDRHITILHESREEDQKDTAEDYRKLFDFLSKKPLVKQVLPLKSFISKPQTSSDQSFSNANPLIIHFKDPKI